MKKRAGFFRRAFFLIGARIPVSSPVFSVERVTLLPNERPFEFVQSVVRGDRYTIVLDLVKPGATPPDPLQKALRLASG